MGMVHPGSCAVTAGKTADTAKDSIRSIAAAENTLLCLLRNVGLFAVKLILDIISLHKILFGHFLN